MVIKKAQERSSITFLNTACLTTVSGDNHGLDVRDLAIQIRWGEAHVHTQLRSDTAPFQLTTEWYIRYQEGGRAVPEHKYGIHMSV